MPGSWEILQQRDRRLLIGLLVPPDLLVSIDFSTHIQQLQIPPGSDYLRLVGAPPGPARNNAAKIALERGCHLAFLDIRLRVPSNAFMALLDTQLDLVAGLYYNRNYPHVPLIFNEGRDANNNFIKVPVRDWKPGDLVPCTFVPGGLTIYRRRLLDAMFARYPRPFEFGMDIAPVPTEGGQVPPFFDDDTFAWRAKQMGVQGFCHTGVVGLYEVRAVVGPRWTIPYPATDPLAGVVGVI